jgi:hypothetical protein
MTVTCGTGSGLFEDWTRCLVGKSEDPWPEYAKPTG